VHRQASIIAVRQFHDAIAAVEARGFRNDALRAAFDSEDDEEAVAIRPRSKYISVSGEYSHAGAFDRFTLDVNRKPGDPRWLVSSRALPSTNQ
jgi:hypothetical protein